MTRIQEWQALYSLPSGFVLDVPWLVEGLRGMQREVEVHEVVTFSNVRLRRSQSVTSIPHHGDIATHIKFGGFFV